MVLLLLKEIHLKIYFLNNITSPQDGEILFLQENTFLFGSLNPNYILQQNI
jgi:hypothetical protein